MSKVLQQALKSYSAGNYQAAATQLQPALRNLNAVDQNVALLMAQSCFKLDRLAEAALWYERAALKGGNNAPMLTLLSANLYWRVKNPKKALGLTRKLLEKNPDNWDARALYRNALRFLLQFEDFEKDNITFIPKLLAGDTTALAAEKLLDNLQWCGDEILQSRLTGIDAHMQLSAMARRLRQHNYGAKIRVGYLSNDFSDQHATMHLLLGTLKAHDPQKFEITLFCHTDDGLISVDQGFRSEFATKIVAIGDLTDAEAASLIRQSGIDILVDLKGHTRDARWTILNHGAAPIQVSYLGFPGFNTGIDCDYVIGDPVVIPDRSRDIYPAKVIRMPESYQANDDTGRALPQAATRQDLKLPEEKIIFAAFNSILKLSAQTFHLWADVLSRVDNSVLWILCDHADVRASLITHLQKRGIAEHRVIFAARAAYADHIARLQAADIALDTFPYNGHTTSSDALWAGLPVPTMAGSNFASRVTESLLNALNMPELVAPNAQSYVELVVDLAHNAEKRQAMKEKILANRFRAPLFDTERFTRHLETAFEWMVGRAKSGQLPQHFDVPALPPRIDNFKVAKI